MISKSHYFGDGVVLPILKSTTLEVLTLVGLLWQPVTRRCHGPGIKASVWLDVGFPQHSAFL